MTVVRLPVCIAPTPSSSLCIRGDLMAHTFNLPMVSPQRVAAPSLPGITASSLPRIAATSLPRIAAPSLPFGRPMCNAVKMTARGRSLSAQALSARTRRRRISDKFRELGELIPGGSRLTTADMLTAGFNYVSFMQAQIGVLYVMRSVQGWNLSREQDQMIGALVASPPIQEKLARQGHCVVPSAVIETMSSHRNITSAPSNEEEDLDQFIDSILSSVGT